MTAVTGVPKEFAYDVTASGCNSSIQNSITDIYLVDKTRKQSGHLRKQERDISYFDAQLKLALIQLERHPGD
ncbi:MAG: hypothetical protein R3174_03010 [Gammaproteobacteria bacterium]|nr:hypothetical protein [Gammaproteobacteria bacterium]